MSASSSTNQFTLKQENQYYELWYDSWNDLDYITLRKDGLDKVAQMYKEKYGIKIVTHLRQSKKGDQGNQILIEMQEVLLSNLHKLENGEVRGVCFINMDADNINLVQHVHPFIAAKNQNGKSIIMVFEGDVNFPKSEEYIVKYSSNFDDMQKDKKSCPTFAIGTVKNCINSEAMMDQIMISDTKDVIFDRMVFAQSSKHFSKLVGEEKSALYLREKTAFEKSSSRNPSSKISDKAFYKSHDIVMKLLDDRQYEKYWNLLSARTQNRILDINSSRMQAGHKPHPRQSQPLASKPQSQELEN